MWTFTGHGLNGLWRRVAAGLVAVLLLQLLHAVGFPTSHGVGVAAADEDGGPAPMPVAEPSSVVLSADRTTIAAGQSATLTATTDVDVAGSASVVSIVDQTTGASVAWCPSGRSCVVAVSFPAGPAHTYVAMVNSRTSNQVTIARQTWSVGLQSSTPQLAAGASAMLTATANQDLGQTLGQYALYVFDADSGVKVAYSGSGTMTGGGVQFVTGAVSHRFVAVVAHDAGAAIDYAQAADVQATSNVVTVGRQPWSLTLSGDLSTIAAGQSATLAVESNQDVGGTGGLYALYVFDATTGAVLQYRTSGKATSAAAVFYSGTAHDYVAVVAHDAGPSLTYGQVTDVQARSNVVRVSRAAWHVGLDTDRTMVAAGERATLTAIADQNLDSSQYAMYIFDSATGEAVGYGNSSVAVGVQPIFTTGGPHRYVAVIAHDAGAHITHGQVSDVQAESNSVSVERAPWSVSLSTDRSEFAAGQPAMLTAQANQDLSATGHAYALYIVDTTTGQILQYTNSSSGISVSPLFFYENYHEYAAVIAHDAGANVAYTDLTDIQATSSSVALSRMLWSVGLGVTGPEPGQDGMLHVQADANQDVFNSGYQLMMIDITHNVVVSRTTSGGSNGTSSVATATSPYWGVMYEAVVARWNADLGIPWDVQAYSNPVMVPQPAGASGDEANGGPNPSENCTQGCAADPINTATGEFFDDMSDIGLPGKGPALQISRVYSSKKAAVDGPFGYGWSFNYATKLTLADPGMLNNLPRTATLTQENGSKVVFTNDGRGRFVAQDRVQATLAYNPSTQRWTFIRRGVQSMVFDNDGWLLSIADPSGNELTLTHDTDGKVTSVSAPGGRSLTLTWNTAGARITGVEDSAHRSVSYDYDSDGNLVTATGIDQGQTLYEYGSWHELTKTTTPGLASTSNYYDIRTHRIGAQKDPLGNWTVIEYAGTEPNLTTTVTEVDGSRTIWAYSDAQLTSRTAAAGTPAEATWAYAYLGNNLITVTDPTGQQVKSTYDSEGNKTTSTDPLNRVTRVQYNAFNEPLLVIDPAGYRTQYSYDAHGNRLSMTSPDDHVTHYTYNPDGTLATVESPGHHTTGYGYDPAGRVVRVTDPNNNATTTTYTADGLPATVTDAENRRTTTTYDAAGRPVSVTEPGNRTTLTSYDADGNPTSVTDPAGNTTYATYDKAGNRTGSTDETGAKTTYTYTKTGKLASVTDPATHTTSNAYDGRGNLTSVTDPANHKTTYLYDSDNRLLSVSTAGNSVSQTAYDWAGQVVSTTDPNNHTTHYTYDLDGRVKTVTDPNQARTEYTYSRDGRLTGTHRADGSDLTTTYDADGNVIAQTDADNRRTTFSYDDAGQRLSRTQPGNLTTSWTYNRARQAITTTDPDGTTSTATYDAAGQLSTSVDHDAAGAQVGQPVHYTYDDNGQTATRTDATGTTTYAYDTAGRPTAITNGSGDTVAYAYDNTGKLTALTYPGGDQLHYGYDIADRLTSATDWNGNTTTFGWTDDNQLATQTTPNGVTTSRSYDLAGQTTHITIRHATTTLGGYAYTYDPAGRLTNTTTTDAAGATAASSYAFTSTGQLASSTTDPAASASAGGPVTSPAGYTTTPGGLLTGLPDGTTQTFNTAAQLVTVNPPTGPPTTYTYDARGNRTTAASNGVAATTTAYSYTNTNQLASVSTGSTGAASTATVEYTYDAAGLRQARTEAGTTTHYIWNIAAGLPALLDDGTHRYLYGAGSTPYAQIDRTGHIDYLHTDLLGSVRATTDTNGALTSTTNYSDYGPPIAHTGNATSAIGYTGAWTDPATGLIYLRARDYDPTTGQFLTVDPLADTTRQPYSYASNNPIQQTDPTGLCAEDPSGNTCLNWFERRVVLKGPSPHSLTHGATGQVTSFFIGVGDGASFGATKQFREWVIPGSSCTFKHNAAYYAGIGTGVVASTIVTGGSSAEAGGAAAEGEAIETGASAMEASTTAEGASAGAAEAEGDLVNLASEYRTEHILRGNGGGGGHLWPGLPGKTPFPAAWSEAKVMHEVSDIATDPAAWENAVVQRNGRVWLQGTRDGVDIKVIVDTVADDIITGHPTNLPRNP
jgi:RHS repeat-associated protein